MTRIALVLLSSALYVCAFPLPGVHLLAWVSLVPLFLALRDGSPGRGFWLGGLWGTTTIWGIGYWVPQSLAVYWEQPVWLGLLLAFIGSLLFMGSYGAGFGACAAWLGRNRSGLRRMSGLTILWVSWELARGRLLSGDPWLLLGYAATPIPSLIQCADLGGVHLVSFVVAFVNAGIAEFISAPRRWRTSLGVPLALLIACAAYGEWRMATLPRAEQTVHVGIVQANTDYGAHWRSDSHGKGLREHLELTRSLSDDVELAVWPESALNVFVAHEPIYRELIGNLARERQLEIIVGAPHLDDRDPAVPRYFNSAFYFSADGELKARYDKVHLLPFGEYFPLRTIAFLRRNFERVRTFTAATEAHNLPTRSGPVAIAICFEAIFPEFVRERMRHAKLLINLSNDAWLGADAGPEQHLAMVAMRAVENRTWVVRAAPTGISAIIDPTGRTIDRLDPQVVGTLEGRVGLTTTGTVYQAVGDAFAFGCVALSALLAVFRLTGRRA